MREQERVCGVTNMTRIVCTFETGLSAFFMVKSVAVDVSLCVVLTIRVQNSFTHR